MQLVNEESEAQLAQDLQQNLKATGRTRNPSPNIRKNTRVGGILLRLPTETAEILREAEVPRGNRTAMSTMHDNPLDIPLRHAHEEDRNAPAAASGPAAARRGPRRQHSVPYVPSRRDVLRANPMSMGMGNTDADEHLAWREGDEPEEAEEESLGDLQHQDSVFRQPSYQDDLSEMEAEAAASEDAQDWPEDQD